jgi:hypothetical protein
LASPKNQPDADPHTREELSAAADTLSARLEEAMIGTVFYGGAIAALEPVTHLTPMRSQTGQMLYYCTAVKFAQLSDRDAFLSDTLPALRREYAALWSPQRMPAELVVD